MGCSPGAHDQGRQVDAYGLACDDCLDDQGAPCMLLRLS